MNSGAPSVLSSWISGGMAGADGVRNRFQPVCLHVSTGQDRQYAWGGAGRCGLDAMNASVRVRRSQHDSMGLAGYVDIVAVASASGQQAQIFLASNRLTNPRARGTVQHSTLPMRRVRRRLRESVADGRVVSKARRSGAGWVARASGDWATPPPQPSPRSGRGRICPPRGQPLWVCSWVDGAGAPQEIRHDIGMQRAEFALHPVEEW